MAFYSGVTGFIKKGATSATEAIASMNSWDVTISREMMERASFGKTYKEKKPGIKDWSAKADGSVDFASTSKQEDLWDAFEDGTLLAFGFGLDDTTYFEGSGYIESLEITNAADGSADVSVSVAGNEGILLTLPASGS